ncbi:sensor histidine kinase [Sphaerisporangium album]|uniref:histidine kinase n=1 Tax=Sphaerisporangium album TaxID=509200 RepID=A0A367FRL1_9ACTN|nr:histidine kinase [Sphaerisporangium album]RCG32347.1 sensor histidine kinase [Sphaerisporangium album]
MSSQAGPALPDARIDPPPESVPTLGRDGCAARAGDVTCVVLSFAFGTLLLRVGDASADPSPTPTWQVDAAMGTLCCLSLWWRHRWPLGLAVALTLVGAVSAMTTAALAVAVFTVAVHRRALVALVLAVTNVAMVTVYFMLQDDPKFPVWVDFAVRGGILAAAVGWGMFARAQRQLVASLRERAARLEAEQHLRVEQARLTERTRIAREMHDVLAHRLSLVSLHAGALEVRMDARREEVATAAGVIRANAHDALQELRAVIGVLRVGVSGPPERPQPGLPDVPELVESARAAGTRVAYACPAGAADGLPSAVGRTAYRLVQEGLTNARKHAPGAAVDVLVDGARGEGLRVRVTNPLPITPPPEGVPGAGMGLVGLRERVTLAGGRLHHGAEPDGRGFRLEAWMPWPA